MNRFLAGLLAAFGLLVTVRASSTLPQLTFDERSGVSIRMTSFYDNIPPAGYLPVRVEIKNDSPSAHTWNWRSTQGSTRGNRMNFETELRVEPQSERTFDLLLPLTLDPASSPRYSNIQVTVTGYGILGDRSSIHSSGVSGKPTAYFGMGDALAVQHRGPLEDRLKKDGGRALQCTALEPAFMPSDWRALAGFEFLVLTADEWRVLEPGPRNAMKDWIAQGGRLVLVHDGPASTVDLLPVGEFGVGQVTLWPLGDDLLDRLDNLLIPHPETLSDILSGDYKWTWPLADQVGESNPPQLAILVYVVLFAVLIGPVNFLVFAPGANRHKLFWTTPLISVVASVLMGLFIFFSEGLGGSGMRFVATLSLGKENKSVHWQEQVSRTGVLLESGFELSEADTLLLPIWISDSKSVAHSAGQGITFSLAGKRWGGDWFRSRETQSQAMISVLPSRGRLEFSAGSEGKPSVVSTFEDILGDVWYFDHDGQLWSARDVRPGENSPLSRARDKDFDDWLNDTLTPAGPLTSGKVQGFAKSQRADKFYASTAAPKLVTSLPSIRWRPGGGMIFGPTAP